MYLKTRQAARQLGCKFHQLINLINNEKLAPPNKDSSGDYFWTEADIERARLALAEWYQKRGVQPIASANT